jgi:transcriptional regulator with XRE-family HTH domain
MKIGDILTELRAKRGLTQDQMADALGIKRPRYNAWENHISSPDIEMVDKIATFHGVSTDYIMGRTSEPHNAASATPGDIKAWLRAGNPDLSDKEKDELAEDIEEYFRMRKQRILKERESKGKE